VTAFAVCKYKFLSIGNVAKKCDQQQLFLEVATVFEFQFLDKSKSQNYERRQEMNELRLRSLTNYSSHRTNLKIHQNSCFILINAHEYDKVEGKPLGECVCLGMHGCTDMHRWTNHPKTMPPTQSAG